MATFQIYLASASPRRRELLRQIGITFCQLPIVIDETPLTGESPPAYVSRLARAKARAGAVSYTHLDVYKRQVGAVGLSRLPESANGD